MGPVRQVQNSLTMFTQSAHWAISVSKLQGLSVCLQPDFHSLKITQQSNPPKNIPKNFVSQKRWSILLIFFYHVTSLKKMLAKNWCWCINRKRRKITIKKPFITYTYLINNTIRIGREIQCFVYAESVIQHYYLALLQEFHHGPNKEFVAWIPQQLMIV